MLFECWVSVANASPTLKQHYFIVSDAGPTLIQHCFTDFRFAGWGAMWLLWHHIYSAKSKGSSCLRLKWAVTAFDCTQGSPHSDNETRPLPLPDAPFIRAPRPLTNHERRSRPQRGNHGWIMICCHADQIKWVCMTGLWLTLCHTIIWHSQFYGIYLI